MLATWKTWLELTLTFMDCESDDNSRVTFSCIVDMLERPHSRRQCLLCGRSYKAISEQMSALCLIFCVEWLIIRAVLLGCFPRYAGEYPF